MNIYLSLFFFFVSLLWINFLIREIMKETILLNILRKMYIYLCFATIISILPEYKTDFDFIAFTILLCSYFYVTVFEMFYTFPDLMKYNNSGLYKKIVLLLFLIIPIAYTLYNMVYGIYKHLKLMFFN